MISVVIPLYNKALCIKRTIESVLQQSYQNFEIIVVDDGSSDDGATIVREISDVRIKLVQKSNSGVSATRNRGIQEANGEYIAFLDGDDVWEKNHLEELHSLIKEYAPEAKVFATNFIRRFPDGDFFVNRTDLSRGIVHNYFKAYLKGTVVNSSCICVQREVLLSIGGFKTQYTMGEDLDLWSRLMRKHRLAYSPVATSIYEIDAPNNSIRNFVDYRKDAAREALRGVSADPYDLFIALRKYLFYLIKKAIKHKPRINKPQVSK